MVDTVSVWIVFSRVLTPRRLFCVLKAKLLPVDQLSRVFHIVLANMYTSSTLSRSLSQLQASYHIPDMSSQALDTFYHEYLHDGLYRLDRRKLPSVVFLQFMQRRFGQHNTVFRQGITDIISKYPGRRAYCGQCNAMIPALEMDTEHVCVFCACVSGVRRNINNELLYTCK